MQALVLVLAAALVKCLVAVTMRAIRLAAQKVGDLPVEASQGVLESTEDGVVGCNTAGVTAMVPRARTKRGDATCTVTAQRTKAR